MQRIIKIKLILMLFIVLVLQLSLVLAKENKTVRLNLEKTISMALDASESYKIETNNIEKSQQSYKEERSQALPQISGEFIWYNNFEYPNVPTTTNTKDYELDSGLALEQKIFTFGRVSSAIKAVRQAVEVSKYDAETTKQKIIYDAKLAYYSVYLAKRSLEIAEQSYKNAKQNEKILRNRLVSGRASKYDNIKISADIASRKPVVNNAFADYYSAIEALKIVVGVDTEANIELTEEFPDSYLKFERDKLAMSLYHNQPAIKALIKSIEKSQYLISAKKAEFYPEISLFGTWNHKGSSNDLGIGGNYLEDYGVGGIKVDVPIWTSGKTSAELAQARINKENAELEYKKGKEDYLLELDKALSRYRSYLKTLESNREAVRLAREAFKLSQEMFEAGKISITDLNDSELKLTNEMLSKESTLFNINVTLAVIERLTLIGAGHE